ncbi:MAG: hypothetical protein QW560_00610 [Candidatus Nitrosocaldus sp.]
MNVLKWRFRSNSRLVEKVITCIGTDSKSKDDLATLFNDMHKLTVIINRLERCNILQCSNVNVRYRYSLTQYGRWLLLCYIFRIRPVQLVILALLYNNYNRSIEKRLEWIVPIIKHEIIRLLSSARVYDEEYAWKQIKILYKRGLCRYYGRDGVVLEHSTYEMLKGWHDDIYALYEHLRDGDHYEVCI